MFATPWAAEWDSRVQECGGSGCCVENLVIVVVATIAILLLVVVATRSSQSNSTVGSSARKTHRPAAASEAQQGCWTFRERGGCPRSAGRAQLGFINLQPSSATKLFGLVVATVARHAKPQAFKQSADLQCDRPPILIVPPPLAAGRGPLLSTRPTPLQPNPVHCAQNGGPNEFRQGAADRSTSRPLCSGSAVRLPCDAALWCAAGLATGAAERRERWASLRSRRWESVAPGIGYARSRHRMGAECLCRVLGLAPRLCGRDDRCSTESTADTTRGLAGGRLGNCSGRR